MPAPVPVKIYAAFFPADDAVFKAVAEAGKTAIGHDEEWLFLEKDILRIAWEGAYFPLDDVLQALLETLGPNVTGKLDYLDMDEWTLTRYTREENTFRNTTRDLNQILEYSGH